MNTEGELIRASTILPARREEIDLHTADGLRLVGELALPAERDPIATLVTLHPLPTHGGFMDSHVFRKAAWRLPALADLAVLRFNLRGVKSPRGVSEGQFDHGNGERHDVAAALAFARERALPRIWLVGWSFGTDLTLLYGLQPEVEGAILLSPPLRKATEEHLQAWDLDGKPLVALIPGEDDYLRPEEARRRFAPVRQAKVLDAEGARHLWVGEKSVTYVLNQIVAAVLPDRTGALPTHWLGETEHADDLRNP